MGTKPFEQVVPRKGNTHLRMLLHSVGVADAAEYRTHDLRRGHTKDMAETGASWEEILEKGDWASKAAPCQSYLPEELVEKNAVMMAHYCESSEEDSDFDW